MGSAASPAETWPNCWQIAGSSCHRLVGKVILSSRLRLCVWVAPWLRLHYQDLSAWRSKAVTALSRPTGVRQHWLPPSSKNSHYGTAAHEYLLKSRRLGVEEPVTT